MIDQIAGENKQQERTNSRREQTAGENKKKRIDQIAGENKQQERT